MLSSVDNPLLRLRPGDVGRLGRAFARAFDMGFLQDLFEKVSDAQEQETRVTLSELQLMALSTRPPW